MWGKSQIFQQLAQQTFQSTSHVCIIYIATVFVPFLKSSSSEDSIITYCGWFLCLPRSLKRPSATLLYTCCAIDEEIITFCHRVWSIQTAGRNKIHTASLPHKPSSTPHKSRHPKYHEERKVNSGKVHKDREIRGKSIACFTCSWGSWRRLNVLVEAP